MITFKKKRLPKGITIFNDQVWIKIYPEGRPYRKYIGHPDEPGVVDLAIAKLSQIREQVRIGKLNIEEKVLRFRMEEACDTYWDLHASKLRSPKTYRYYLNDMKKFFAGRYVDSITYLDVQHFRRDAEKTAKASSVNKKHTTLTCLFNKLKEWRRLRIIKNVKLPEENPGPLVRKASEMDLVRKRVVTEEEFSAFLNQATNSVRRICMAAVHTMLRRRDLMELTRGNVNVSTNTLEGVQSKTGKPFSIPINDPIQDLIDTARGHYLFDFTNFRKDFEKAKKDSKVAEFQFRDLRRTGARMMLKKGYDISTVSAILGHTTITMTQRYVPSSTDDRRTAMAVLGTTYRWSTKDSVVSDDSLMAPGQTHAQVPTLPRF